MSKALVIGCTGGVGAAIVDVLKQKEYEIIGVNRSGKDSYSRSYQVEAADIFDHETLLPFTDGVDIIFGAFNASRYTDQAWADEFPRLMEAFIQLGISTGKRMVFIDNLYMYEYDNPIVESSSKEASPTFKGLIRKEIADKFIDASESKSIDGVIVRGSDLFGPYALNSIIGDRFFSKLFTENTAEVLPLKDYKHSFTYTYDFARTAIAAAEAEKGTYVYHVPSTSLSYLELVRSTYQVAGEQPKEAFVPSIVFKLLGLFTPEIKSINQMSYAWNSEYIIGVQNDLGITPTLPSESIATTVEWFRNYVKVKTIV